MSNSSPSPETVIRRAIRVALRQVRVALPGRVESYDAKTCQADVQPLIMEAQPQPDGSLKTALLPVVPHVPVLFVGGGGSRLTFPVKAGDTCMLVFSSSSLDRWLALGGEVDPQDDRHHHLTDAIAIVGLDDFASVKPAHATATVLEGDDVRIGDDTGTAAALHSELNDLIGILSGAGTGAATAIPTAISTYQAAHSGWPLGAQKVKVK